jgi:hypothetical protein
MYAYDIDKKELVDLSTDLPEGVLTTNQGILTMSYMPEENTLVCLSHPLSDIVFYNLDTNMVDKVVPGIPWRLGNPMSREVLVTKNGKIYTYRGSEDPAQRSERFHMWEYDVDTEVMKETKYEFTNGFWNGQASTKDGSKIYISTCNGGLYVLDTKSGIVEDLGIFLTDMEIGLGTLPEYFYSITLSRDETEIYGIPSAYNGFLYRYDIETKTVSKISEIGAALSGLGKGQMDLGWYTGNNIIDSKGTMYFAYFWGSFQGCRLISISPSK